ncbi:MAG TPA: hypothetical protein VKG63_15415 [Steroidobacteraceae bacterium]|nr:hypothetical protein [Steroidobacteraceae bacterium]
MVPLASLWLPVLISAVIVFLASWIVHMFVPLHRRDFEKLPQEDALLETLRSMNIPSGQYLAPFANTPAQMKQPDYVEKRKRGPAIFLTLAAGPDTGMGKSLLQWFIYLLVISVFIAYVAHHAIPAGAPYPGVFKIVTVAAFMAYALGHPHQSIWYRQAWRTTVVYLIDGLIYSLLTAGVFGWLWPR